MTAQEFDAGLERALILGSRRQPIAVPDAYDRGDPARSLLGYMALASARSRYARPAPPSEFLPDAPDARYQDKRYPDWPIRRLLHRFFGPKASGDRMTMLARRVQASMARRALTVHPFDAADLKKVTADAPTTNSFDWETGTPIERAHHLEALRSVDPSAARSLMESEISSQTAAHRKRWLETLEFGLSGDDVELLNGRLTDRARSVADFATELLTRIPGTPQHEAHVADALTRIEKKSERFRRRVQLTLDAPRHLRDDALWSWLRNTIGRVPPAAFAARFAIAAEDLPDALDGALLRRALYLSAVRSGDRPLASELSAGFRKADVSAIFSVTEDLADRWSPEQTEILAATAVPLRALAEPVNYANVAMLFAWQTGATIALDRAEHMLDELEPDVLLRSDLEKVETAMLSWLVALPNAVHPKLLEACSALPGPSRREAEDFAELLHRIENQ